MVAGTDKSLLHAVPSSETAPAAALRSFFLSGPAGRLEALLNEGRADSPYVTVLCHPHPKGGGTMHNKVVYHAMKMFSSLGWPVLRFNFRGTGLSEGEHDGAAEVEDVSTALDWMSAEFGKPIVAAGFSFGAAMGLRAARKFPHVVGFTALGLPTQAEGRHYTYPHMHECLFPKLFLSGDRDQYAPVDQLGEIVATALDPKQLTLIADADHFFTGHLPAMQAALLEWLHVTFTNSPHSQLNETAVR
jgi:alpha/beta superfamily hydrolase